MIDPLGFVPSLLRNPSLSLAFNIITEMRIIGRLSRERSWRCYVTCVCSEKIECTVWCAVRAAHAQPPMLSLALGGVTKTTYLSAIDEPYILFWLLRIQIIILSSIFLIFLSHIRLSTSGSSVWTNRSTKSTNIKWAAIWYVQTGNCFNIFLFYDKTD